MFPREKAQASTSLANSPLVKMGAGFLSWWLGELGALIPQRIRDWWSGTNNSVLLTLNDSSASVEAIGGTRDSSARLDLSVPQSADVARTQVPADLSRIFGDKFRLFVAIPPEWAIRRTITVPIALEENLRESLGYELDRFTPFRAEQAYFDFRVVDRLPEAKQLRIGLVVVQKESLDQLLTKATAMGLAVSGALLRESYIKDGSYNGFLSYRSEPRRNNSFARKRVALAFIAVALLATALVIPVVQKRSAAIALLEPMSQAKEDAKRADELRAKLDKRIHEINFPTEQKWASPSFLLVLEELTKILPDDTYVSRMEFNGKEIQLQGESSSASGLVGILESSRMFKEVSFKSQLTKVQGTTNDRFHILATVHDALPLQELAKKNPADQAPAAVAPLPEVPPPKMGGRQ